MKRAAAGFVLALVAACAPPEAAQSTAPTTNDNRISCADLATRVDGGCCPAGAWFDPGAGICVPVGPPECAATVLDAPELCVPRWCADAAASADCAPGQICVAGRRCTAAELTDGLGCPAGQWRPLPEGDCEPAGGNAGIAALAADPGAAPAAPPLTTPRWCWAGDAAAVAACADWTQGTCAASAAACDAPQGCPAGMVPDATPPHACRPAGVTWTCPPGFIVAGGGSEFAPPGCIADPAACPEDPFGDTADDKADVYVDANAAPGGDGSRQAPLRKITFALTKVPTGGTIAIAAGNYPEYLTLTRVMSLRGRCAAKVSIDSLEDTPAVAVFMGGGAGLVRLSGMRLSGKSAGVAVAAKVPVEMSGLWVQGAHAAGISVQAHGANATLRDSVVAGTVATANHTGYGVQIVKGDALTLERVRLSGNTHHGLQVQSPGAMLRVDGLMVDGTLPAPGDGAAGGGVGLYEDLDARLNDVSLYHNHSFGLVAAGAKVVARVTSLRAAHTQVHPNSGLRGHGVEVQLGARLDLFGAALEANHGSAVGAYKDVQTRLFGVLASKTKPWPDQLVYGFGASATLAARLEIVASRFTANHHAGLVAGGAATVLHATDVLVDGMLRHPKSPDIASGLHAGTGASVRLLRVRLSGTPGYGMLATDAGTQVQAFDLLVDATTHDPGSGAIGRGVEVLNGAAMFVRGGWLHRSLEVAGRAVGKESRMDLLGVRIDATMPSPHTANWGIGLVLADRAQAQLAGCDVSGSRHSGVIASATGTFLSAVGTRVADTLPASPAPDLADRSHDGHFGIGLGIINGASAEVRASWLGGNHSAGIMATLSHAKVDGCVVVHTQLAEYRDTSLAAPTQLADGIALLSSLSARVSETVVFGSERAGLLIDGGANVEVSNLAVKGNLIGIVRQSAAAAALKDNAVWQNSQANMATDIGLVAPLAPQVAVP